jgi:hypothetical protein
VQYTSLARILKRQARYPDCPAAIFEEAGALPRLPCRIFFFWPAQSVDCRATIFLLAGVTRQFPRLNFFQLAGAIPQLPYDCCFLVLRPFAAIRHNTQASRQPFGTILKPCAKHLARYSALRQPFANPMPHATIVR